MRKLTFLIFISLICSTCRKKVTKKNMDYVGTWIEPDPKDCHSVIIIDEYNNGEYKNTGHEEECQDDRTGTARLGKKVLVIGMWHFKILESATQIPDTVFSLMGNVTESNMRMKVSVPNLLSGNGETTLYKKK